MVAQEPPSVCGSAAELVLTGLLGTIEAVRLGWLPLLDRSSRRR